MKKIFKKLAWAICVFFVFSSLLLQSVSAKGNNSVSFYGRWEEGARSISSSIPISAFVNDGVLSIHSSTQRSDITICISKDGKILYEEMIPASETDCVTIDLSEFEPGTYSVKLKINGMIVFGVNLFLNELILKPWDKIFQRKIAK